MLATIGDVNLLDRKDMYFEAKLDGIRALCYKKTKLKFTSRSGIVITDKYPEFDFFANLDAQECILDGEILVYDEKGMPSFQLWSERNHGKEHTATYVVFDILYYNGKSLLNEPLYARKKILEKVVKECPHLQLSFITRKGRELWKLIQEKGGEGVMAKKDDSSYELGTRSDAWRKIKITQDIDCVIIGYTTQKRALTSLALGLYQRGVLQYAGKVGTGFDEKTMASLKSNLDQLKTEKTVVETEPGVIAVKSTLVVQVRYHELTKQGKLRAPVFMRLRQDKRPDECVVP